MEKKAKTPMFKIKDNLTKLEASLQKKSIEFEKLIINNTQNNGYYQKYYEYDYLLFQNQSESHLID